MNEFLIHIALKPLERKILFLDEWQLENSKKNAHIKKQVIDYVSYFSNSCDPILFNLEEGIYIHIDKYFAAGDEKLLAQKISEHYKAGTLDNYFANLDGEVIAIIIDISEKRVLVFSDRFGLIPIYIHTNEDSIFISSSPKFIYLNHTKIEIRKRSVECYLAIGYLPGKYTFFEGIDLIDSSKKIEIDYERQGNKIQESHYWTWDKINKNIPSFDKAVKETAEAFHDAVRKRQKQREENILLLSGGMDSRLILSCVDNSSIKKTYTVSKRFSKELTIAKKLSKEKGMAHEHLLLTEANWINGRAENIWRLDAGFSLMHDHAAPFSSLKNHRTAFFNGMGGPILTGTYLKKNNTKITSERARSFYGEFWTETNVDSPFYQLNKVEPYFLDTRSRPFTNSGVRSILPSKPLLPFLDIEFLSVLLSIDDSYRKDRKLYFSVALKLGEKLFSKYDYVKLYRPISRDQNLWDSGKKLYAYTLSKVFNIESVSYVNYKRWINTIRKVIPQLLNKNSVLSEILGEDISKRTDVKNLPLTLRLMTLEIYFKQIFHGKLFTTENLKALEL